jgi:translation elongation factor EF-Ts
VGLVGSYIHDGRISVLVEVNSETDFVAEQQELQTREQELCKRAIERQGH